MSTADEFKEYLLKIPSIKTQKDSDAFCDWFCTKENKRLWDEKTYSRSKELLWKNGQAGGGKKSKLTKFFKSLFNSEK
jgi:hypothetical protein